MKHLLKNLNQNKAKVRKGKLGNNIEELNLIVHCILNVRNLI